MDFARHSSPFSQHEGESVTNVLHPQSPGCDHRKDDHQPTGRFEPYRLEEKRSNREGEDCTCITRPSAADGHGPELVTPRREICVEGFPARAGVDPFVIETIQSIAKAYLAGIRQCGSGIGYLDPRRARRKTESRAG